MKKVEMENKINQLEQKIVDMETIKYRTEIEKHRIGYIHIPWSTASFGRMMLCWGSLWLVVFNVFSLFYFWGYFNIGNLFQQTDKIGVSLVSTSQLFFLYPLFAWFFSCWLFFVLAKVFCDGGWDNVGDFVGGLVGGLVVGLVGGLVFGLVGGILES